MSKLEKDYNKAVTRYVDEFSKKNDVDFDCWIADNVGEIACIGDYYIDFINIKTDIDCFTKPGSLFEYLDKELDFHLEKDKESFVNYLVKVFPFLEKHLVKKRFFPNYKVWLKNNPHK